MMTPHAGYHFRVDLPLFLSFNGRFQEVSGIEAKTLTQEVREGGMNLQTRHLKNGVHYTNLILKRGMVLDTFELGVDGVMSSMQTIKQPVIVSLLNASGLPLSCWGFHNAYPVNWKIDGLNANENGIAMETVEFAYERSYTIPV